MRFLPVRDCCGRAFERKKTLICFAALMFVCFILGVAFIKTPAIYDYHLNMCDRFVNRVCYSQISVFVIFLEHLAGGALLLALFLLAGVHFAGLILPPMIIIYRSYTCGGSVAILFSVYGFSGILIALILYLPIRIFTDLCFLFATALSCSRARQFRFCKEDFRELLLDFAVLFVMLVLVFLLEMILLLALFHTAGNNL